MVAGWKRLVASFMLGTVAAAAFSNGDTIKVLASHVGPVNNPSETYNYFVLPYCSPTDGGEKSPDIAESLTGDRKVTTAYEFKFNEPEEFKELCVRTFQKDEVERLARAVEEDWYVEMFADELPMWSYVGEHEAEDFLLGHTDKSRHFLYTHMHFTLGVNGDKVVAANVTASQAYRQDITGTDEHETLGLGDSASRRIRGGEEATSSSPLRVTFSYSVSWAGSDVRYENRMDVYGTGAFLPSTLEIHWLSIINSLVLVMLLTTFLAIILLRVVKNDFTRYMRAEEEEEAGTEETGWKLVHADVFRPPASLSLFTSMVGAGAHLLVVTTLLLTAAVTGMFSVARRGAIVAACILLYVLTAGVGGFVTARLYKQMRGTSWVWNILLNLLLVPGPVAAVFAVLNTTAVVKSSTAALPAFTIALVVLAFAVIAAPLAIIFGVWGHQSREYEPPCRTSKVPRQVPAVSWYRTAPVQLLLAGFLPFSAISIELHYIFASVWGHKVYTLYGILAIAFGLLVLVTAFITIALTYFQLAAEDHRWWWRSFLSGGCVGFFIYAYCFVYFYSHSGMTGFLQTSFYFGYMAVVALGFFLMMGTVGFMSSWTFVRYIYSSIKTD